MYLRLLCEQCRGWTTTRDVNASQWSCRHCGGKREAFRARSVSQGNDELSACRACGNTELYRQKAFPQWLGMLVVVIASAGFLVFHWYYQFILAWACLIGAAVLDTLLYFCMGNVTVCYRCLTHHRGFQPSPQHQPFDLGVAEKHRQERLRREELRRV